MTDLEKRIKDGYYKNLNIDKDELEAADRYHDEVFGIKKDEKEEKREE